MGKVKESNRYYNCDILSSYQFPMGKVKRVPEGCMEVAEAFVSIPCGKGKTCKTEISREASIVSIPYGKGKEMKI